MTGNIDPGGFDANGNAPGVQPPLTDEQKAAIARGEWNGYATPGLLPEETFQRADGTIQYNPNSSVVGLAGTALNAMDWNPARQGAGLVQDSANGISDQRNMTGGTRAVPGSTQLPGAAPPGFLQQNAPLAQQRVQTSPVASVMAANRGLGANLVGSVPNAGVGGIHAGANIAPAASIAAGNNKGPAFNGDTSFRSSIQQALPTLGGANSGAALPGVRDGTAQSTGTLGGDQAALRASMVGTGAQAAAGQASLAQLQQQAAVGNGPTAATDMLKTAARSNVNNLAALAANTRGGNSAAAVRNASVGGQDLALQSQAQLGALRANEMIAAREQLRGVLSDTRGQDINAMTMRSDALNSARNSDISAADVTNRANVDFRNQDVNRENNVMGNNVANRNADTAQFNAVSGNNLGSRSADTQSFIARNNASLGVGQQNIDAFNATSNAGLKSRELDDAALQNSILNSMGLGRDVVNNAVIDDNTKLQIADRLQAAKSADLDYQAAKKAGEASKRGQNIGIATGIINGVATVGAAKSDRRAKTNIGEIGEDELRKLLGKLKPSSFDYKEPDSEGAARGKRFGIMAQDLEKSAVGKALVREKNGVKMVDVGQSVGTLLAAAASLHKRLEKVERA